MKKAQLRDGLGENRFLPERGEVTPGAHLLSVSLDGGAKPADSNSALRPATSKPCLATASPTIPYALILSQAGENLRPTLGETVLGFKHKFERFAFPMQPREGERTQGSFHK